MKDLVMHDDILYNAQTNHFQPINLTKEARI